MGREWTSWIDEERRLYRLRVALARVFFGSGLLFTFSIATIAFITRDSFMLYFCSAGGGMTVAGGVNLAYAERTAKRCAEIERQETMPKLEFPRVQSRGEGISL
jgi:hypothetical protein